MSTWYIAQVAPGREIIARDHIIWRGHGAFVPVWRKTIRSRGLRRQHTTVERPWLPRYVFIEGPSIPWWLLDRMTIVHGVLAPNGQPLAIPQTAIDWFTANNGRMIDAHTGYERPITINDLVKVASGPFCGTAGKVAFIKGKTAGVPLNVLGSQRIVRFPLDQLEVA